MFRVSCNIPVVENVFSDFCINDLIVLKTLIMICLHQARGIYFILNDFNLLHRYDWASDFCIMGSIVFRH